MHANVRRAMNQAYESTDADLSQRQLERLARSLERDHPGAAASVREGLVETLTLQRLGVAGTLDQSLRNTNAIENLNGSVVSFCRNVRRWRNGSMLFRWIVASLRPAQKDSARSEVTIRSKVRTPPLIFPRRNRGKALERGCLGSRGSGWFGTDLAPIRRTCLNRS